LFSKSNFIQLYIDILHKKRDKKVMILICKIGTYTNTIQLVNRPVIPTAVPRGQNVGDIFDKFEIFSNVFFLTI
jgi:hypothetical protein